jgi:hypothetical protein
MQRSSSRSAKASVWPALPTRVGLFRQNDPSIMFTCAEGGQNPTTRFSPADEDLPLVQTPVGCRSRRQVCRIRHTIFRTSLLLVLTAYLERRGQLAQICVIDHPGTAPDSMIDTV